jgi:hypothetical protein
VEAGEIIIEEVVAPLLQEKFVPPPAVNVADCPEQMDAAPEITGTGNGFTETVIVVSSEHEPLDTVTV